MTHGEVVDKTSFMGWSNCIIAVVLVRVIRGEIVSRGNEIALSNDLMGSHSSGLRPMLFGTPLQRTV